jgi:hypothetical protein
MGNSETSLDKFKETFKEELAGIQDIEELKDIFASELARRDRTIKELQEQNKLLLQSAFREKKSQIDLSQ